MIDPNTLLATLRARGIKFFTGVPDSTLKDFVALLEDAIPNDNHVIAANEGNAVAIAAGYHLASGEHALVYMQNSGLGNAVNPLISLASAKIYKLPMLLLIGWRGAPDCQDEPQHLAQGEITIAQLGLLGIPAFVMGSESDPGAIVAKALDEPSLRQGPVALVVKPGTFSGYKKALPCSLSSLPRREAISIILSRLSNHDLVVATTGKISRELYELRHENSSSDKFSDFLMVGSMGHASSMALGVAMHKPERRVVCLDGDGAALMHLGAMCVIGNRKPHNLLHILLNNGAHDSVGGQPTAGRSVSFKDVALGAGYEQYYHANDATSLAAACESALAGNRLGFIEVKVALGADNSLSRPKHTPEDIKHCFMKACRCLSTR